MEHVPSSSRSTPKSPSKPTSAHSAAGGDQRSSSTSVWRTCVKPKPKKQKSVLPFPLLRTSSSGSNSSSSSSDTSLTSSNILPLPPAPAAAAASIPPSLPRRSIQVRKPVPPKPPPRPPPSDPTRRFGSAFGIGGQAKITSYFVPKSASQESKEQLPPPPVMLDLDEEDEEDADTFGQSQSLSFAPMFTSTQANFEDVTFVQSGLHNEPQRRRHRHDHETTEAVEVTTLAPKIQDLSVELFGDEENEVPEEEPDVTDADQLIERSRSPSPSLITTGLTRFVLPSVARMPRTPERFSSPKPADPRTPTAPDSPDVAVGELTMDLIRNYNRVPGRSNGPPSPGYAYKPDKAIRKKDERANLQGWDCDMCRGYYEAIASQLTAEELQRIKNKCSRHRAKYAPNLNNTPPGYWDVDFPTTQECIDKGYMGIGIRTPPRKPPTTAGVSRVSRGSQSPLFSTPPPVAAGNSPTTLQQNEATPIPRISVSPVTPISPFETSNSVSDTTPNTTNGANGTNSKRISSKKSADGWRGTKSRVKKPKPKHISKSARSMPTSPLARKSRPPQPQPPEPSPSTSTTVSRSVPGVNIGIIDADVDVDADYARAMVEFDQLHEETMLDTEDLANFCPLSPSLTPKWPRSDKIIEVPQLAVGRRSGTVRSRKSPSPSSNTNTGRPKVHGQGQGQGPTVKKLGL